MMQHTLKEKVRREVKAVKKKFRKAELLTADKQGVKLVSY